MTGIPQLLPTTIIHVARKYSAPKIEIINLLPEVNFFLGLRANLAPQTRNQHKYCIIWYFIGLTGAAKTPRPFPRKPKAAFRQFSET
jgi:hypothetical protein